MSKDTKMTISLLLWTGGKLNVEADTLTKAYLTVIWKEKGSRRQQQIHGEGWFVWLDKRKVTSRLWENIPLHFHKPKIFK